MSTLVVLSKGRIALPEAVRRRLGIDADARLELIEEPDGFSIRLMHEQSTEKLSAGAGTVKARPKGVERSLQDFDAASMLSRRKPGSGYPKAPT